MKDYYVYMSEIKGRDSTQNCREIELVFWDNDSGWGNIYCATKLTSEEVVILNSPIYSPFEVFIVCVHSVDLLACDMCDGTGDAFGSTMCYKCNGSGLLNDYVMIKRSTKSYLVDEGIISENSFYEMDILFDEYDI